MLLRDDLFLSRFSTLSLLLVFFSFIRVCLGLGHPAVYRMNGFSLKIHVTCFQVAAAFLLKILSCFSCSLLLKCVLFRFSEFVFWIHISEFPECLIFLFFNLCFLALYPRRFLKIFWPFSRMFCFGNWLLCLRVDSGFFLGILFLIYGCKIWNLKILFCSPDNLFPQGALFLLSFSFVLAFFHMSSNSCLSIDS